MTWLLQVFPVLQCGHAGWRVHHGHHDARGENQVLATGAVWIYINHYVNIA